MSRDWGGVRELASHYVQLISKEQRHGPYFLGGYSYGGLVAYEMASLLTEQNQRVEFVGMLDTFAWYPHSRTITTRLASMQDNATSFTRQLEVCVKGGHGNGNLVTGLIECHLVKVFQNIQNYCHSAIDY